MRAVSIQGTPVPGDACSARVRAFPGMTVEPARDHVVRRARRAPSRAAHVLDPLDATQTSIWAKGPPARSRAALEKAGVDTYYMTTDRRRSARAPTCCSRRGRTPTCARSRSPPALLVLVGLLLYLQARQRSQAIASALGAADGARRGAEALSLCLEVGRDPARSRALLGAAVAIAAAQPVVKQIDPLPDRPPSPVVRRAVDVDPARGGGARRGRGRGRAGDELARPPGRRERGAARCLTPLAHLRGALEDLRHAERRRSRRCTRSTRRSPSARSPRWSGRRAAASRRCCARSRGSTGRAAGSLGAGGRELAHASPAALRHHRLATVTFVNQKAADNFVPHLTRARARRVAADGPRELLADFGLDRAPRLAADPALGRRAGAGRVRARARAGDAGDRRRRADGRARPRLRRPAARRRSARHAGEGAAFVIATHDADVIAIADRVLYLDRGPRRRRARARAPERRAVAAPADGESRRPCRGVGKSFRRGGETIEARARRDARAAPRRGRARCSAARARASRRC